MAKNPEKMGEFEKAKLSKKAGNYGGAGIQGHFGEDSGTVGGSGPARAKSAHHDAKARPAKGRISY